MFLDGEFSCDVFLLNDVPRNEARYCRIGSCKEAPEHGLVATYETKETTAGGRAGITLTFTR